MKLFSVRIVAALLVLFSGLCFGDDFKPDLQSIVRDTQQLSEAQHVVTLVWWIPHQYWRVTFEASKKLTPEQIDDFMKTVKPYIVVAAVKGKIGSFGGMTYEDEATLRSKLVLVDRDGNEYHPLDSGDIRADMQNFLDMMKPVMANMLGGMGQNLDFFVFRATNKDGQLIADAEKEGQFSVRLGTENFKWRLPLGCFMAPKVCPKCGEKLSGAYKFCPFDGTALGK